MELDQQRAQLVGSGALARLLPYQELALQKRMDALKQVRHLLGPHSLLRLVTQSQPCTFQHAAVRSCCFRLMAASVAAGLRARIW